MAVRTREEILAAVQARLGDDVSDDALSFVEDIQDTMADLETRANGDGVNWQQKYEQNDREWRDKYKARFFNGGTNGDDNDDDNDDTNNHKPLTFEDLFKEVK